MIIWLLGIVVAVFAHPVYADTDGNNNPLSSYVLDDYTYGQYLFAQRDYYRAISAFKRSLYFNRGKVSTEEINYRIALSYFAAERYDKAVGAFHSFREEFPNSTFRGMADLYIGRSWDISGNRELARNIFTRVIDENGDAADDVTLALAWSYAQDRKWKETVEVFDQLKLEFPESEFAQISAESSADIKNSSVQRKSVWLAAVLSVMPGGGQLYAGRYADAFNSLLIIGVSAGLAVKGSNLNSGLTRASLFIGTSFYVGNLYGGINAALQYNKEKEEALIQRIGYRLRSTSFFNFLQQ